MPPEHDYSAHGGHLGQPTGSSWDFSTGTRSSKGLVSSASLCQAAEPAKSLEPCGTDDLRAQSHKVVKPGEKFSESLKHQKNTNHMMRTTLFSSMTMATMRGEMRKTDGPGNKARLWGILRLSLIDKELKRSTTLVNIHNISTI